MRFEDSVANRILVAVSDAVRPAKIARALHSVVFIHNQRKMQSIFFRNESG